MNRLEDDITLAAKGDEKALARIARTNGADACRALEEVACRAKADFVQLLAIEGLERRSGDRTAIASLAAIAEATTIRALRRADAATALARQKNASALAAAIKLARAEPAHAAVIVPLLSDRVYREKPLRSDRRLAQLFLDALGEPRLRVPSVRALGTLKDRRAVKPLCKLLDDKSVDVRLSVYQALGAIGDSAALPALEARARRATKAERSYNLDRVIARLSR